MITELKIINTDDDQHVSIGNQKHVGSLEDTEQQSENIHNL